MRRYFKTCGTAFGALALAGCASVSSEGEVATAPGSEAVALKPASEINTLFATYDEAQLELSPIAKSYRGIRDGDYDEWGDFSDAAEVRRHELMQSTAATMRANFDPATLSRQDALSYRLFQAMADRRGALHPYRHLTYDFDQMNGAQSDLPAFLINIHSVSNADEARAYVSRIEGLGAVIETLTEKSREKAANGAMPPDWVYPYVISDIENLLGAGLENAVLADFATKVGALDLPASEETALRAAAQLAWEESAAPSYARLLAEMKRQQAIAPTDDGIWRFAEGAEYYKALLANYTTTDLSADEIHAIGLREVERAGHPPA